MKQGESIREIYPSSCKTMLQRPLFLSGVSAGFPSPADDYLDRKLDLNEYLIKNQAATFFVRVAGDSMTGAGIPRPGHQRRNGTGNLGGCNLCHPCALAAALF